MRFEKTIDKILSPQKQETESPSCFAERVEILSESVLDWPRSTLAPVVWDKTDKLYRLKPTVRKRILYDIENIPEEYRKHVYLIGSICTYNYNDRSDLDIHIIPAENISSAELEKWQNYAKMKSGKLLGQHPINYYLHGPDERPYADSTYDVLADKWKRWMPIKKIDLNDYYEKFKKAVDIIDLSRAELYRDIIDIEELRDAYDNASPRVRDDIESEIDKKLDEINQEADSYVNLHADLKDKRNDALHSDFPNEEARSSLPDNVIFLLIRRYGYGSLAKALKKLKKEKTEIGSPHDLKTIKKAFYTREFIDRLENKIKLIL